MKNNKILQIVGLSILVFLLIFGISAFIGRNEISQNKQNEEPRTINISLTIDGIYTDKPVEASLGNTVLEILESLNREDKNLVLMTKEYSGLGILVEGMGGNKNGDDNRYWQYFVNGLMPQIGADKFELQNGDFVEWRFEKSEF